jgi:hypothetical protein
MPGFAASLALIAAGVVVAAVGGGVATTAIGLALAGIGAVVGVSAAFWIIGRSEDRERNSSGPPG